MHCFALCFYVILEAEKGAETVKERENSGGFMIARTFAELTAVLSDEDAGRILKGLIHEFWGYGEQADVSENPLLAALYNSIVQSAKEIDDNYQAHREQKREAGRKGGLAKKQKSCSAIAEPSDAKECCDGAKLNKSKSKENKSKENESKVSESKSAAVHTPPSAALTEEQREILVDKYGQSAVEEYEQRYAKWSGSKAHCNANANSCISKWLSEDKPERKKEGFSSFDIEQVERAITDRYRQLE